MRMTAVALGVDQHQRKRKIDMENEHQSHEITIYVNNKPFKTTEHELTGAQIKSRAGIPPEYELFRVEGQNSVPVGNDERVHLHEKEHFRAIPSGTFGDNGFASEVS